jgi:hypothetical protein
MLTMNARRWIAAISALVLIAVVVLASPVTRDTPKTVGLRFVRPDGQPLPPEESGDHEVVLASGCGVERWAVKTGTDADRGKVSTNIVSTSIQSLVSRPKPAHYPTNTRIAPTELHTWQVTATITQYKEEADSDIHLVLKDAQNRSMIAEIPAPSCVGSTSRWRASITTARSTWTHIYPISTSWHHISRVGAEYSSMHAEQAVRATVSDIGDAALLLDFARTEEQLRPHMPR